MKITKRILARIGGDRAAVKPRSLTTARKLDEFLAATTATRIAKVQPMTTIEAKFALLWGCEQINGPALVRQHKFHPDRKWLFDFANPEARVAIELEGGTWVGYQRGGGRRGGWHQNPRVYAANCEKYRAAELMGWHVFRFTTEQVTFDEVKPVAEFCRGVGQVMKTVLQHLKA